MTSCVGWWADVDRAIQTSRVISLSKYKLTWMHFGITSWSIVESHWYWLTPCNWSVSPMQTTLFSVSPTLPKLDLCSKKRDGKTGRCLRDMTFYISARSVIDDETADLTRKRKTVTHILPLISVVHWPGLWRNDMGIGKSVTAMLHRKEDITTTLEDESHWESYCQFFPFCERKEPYIGNSKGDQQRPDQSILDIGSILQIPLDRREEE